jgi:hypothetical protein
MTATMRSIVLRKPGPAENLELEDISTAHADIDANRVAGKLVGLADGVELRRRESVDEHAPDSGSRVQARPPRFLCVLVW